MVLALGLTVPGWARQLECPDGDALHHAEATATSAPEVKMHAGSDLHTASPQIKPLAQKALRLAREQRAAAMQRGIEEECPAGQTYVGEIPEHRGCETRIISRPADPGREWVQVIAIGKYDWACCAPAPAKGGVSMTLEGPIAGQASTGTPASPAKPSKK